MAARWPPGPEPITIRSNGCILGFLRGPFERSDCRRLGPWLLSINDRGILGRLDAGVVTSTGSKAHQKFLDRKALTIAGGEGAGIGAIGGEKAGFACVA